MMATRLTKQAMLDLIIEAKRTDPETGSFAEWLADYLIEHLPTTTEQPTIDAVPVVHGAWDYIGTDKKGNVFRCSNCAGRIGLDRKTNYCPYCGAKMDLEG